MIKTLLCPFILMFLGFSGHSQQTVSPTNYPTLELMHYNVMKAGGHYLTNESYYLNFQFQNGKLTSKSNELLNNIGIRYNVVEDEMECKIKNQHSRITSPHKLEALEINGNQFEYSQFLQKRDTSIGYIQKIHEGKQSVYVRYYVSSIDKSSGIAEIGHYFLTKEIGNLPKKVNSAKRIVSEAYSNLSKQAYGYMRQRLLSWNNPNDLTQLFTYLEYLNNERVASR